MSSTERPVSRRLLVGVALGIASWCLLGAGVHATAGGRVTADEPQYLLTALSLAEDGDLDIGDELTDERWRSFHPAPLPVQTEPRPDGTVLSPHDPLLPAILAPGVGVAGWVGARITMSVSAGVLASVLVWTAVARLGVPVRPAVVVVVAASAGAPVAAYGTQIYPELPAALAVAVAAAAILGPSTPRSTAVWVAAVVALPWLGVKYVLVAGALATIGLAVLAGRDRLRRALVAGGTLVVAGVVYMVVHRRVYGGLTVYAAGDHFVDGELTVIGRDPNHLGRTVRLVNLLVDRHFGLLAWAPVWLLTVPASVRVLRGGGRRAAVLLGPLAAGWATATWIAESMHDWSWPGRQVVVVLPLAVLALAADVAHSPRRLRLVVLAGTIGALGWLWIVIESTVGDLRLVVDLADSTSPWFRLVGPVLPDQRADDLGAGLLTAGWVVVLVLLAGRAWRRDPRSVAARAGGTRGPGRDPERRSARDEDPLAGERSDADRVAGDLDRGGAVR